MLVLVGATLSGYLGELLRSHLGFLVWVSAYRPALFFYKLFGPDSQAIEVFQDLLEGVGI
jgi:hypothetical protein